MKLKKTIKKIVALGTGLTMVGATILGASAADLANYPEQFIEDGVFDGIMVVGEQAAASDVIGAVDIATNLQVESTTESTVNTEAGTSVTIEGDAYRIDESTDFLELNEELRSVRSGQLDEGDLEALESGTIRAKNTVSYNQRLKVPEKAKVEFRSDDDDDDDVAAKYLTFPDKEEVYEYEIEFPTGVKSDLEGPDGSEDTLDDLEDQKITLLGSEYTITTAELASDDDVKLDLMGGALEATQSEYETKTYTLDGVDYEIEVVAISSANDPEVILSVNGETTDKLVEDDTYELEDGVELGIKTTIENEGTETGGEDIVTFYLGAQKMTLENGEEVEVGNEDMDNADVVIDSDGAIGEDDATINYITVTFSADDDYFVPVGGALSDEIEFADQIFGEGFDINYVGSETSETDEIELSDSNEELTLTMTQNGGNEVDVPLAFADGSTSHRLGSEDEKLHIEEDATADNYQIEIEDYLVIKSGDEKSKLLQYTGYDAEDDQITFEDIGEGAEITRSLNDGDGQGSISIGGETYLVEVDYVDADTDDQDIEFDLDNSGDFSDKGKVDLYTEDRWRIEINGTEGEATFDLFLWTPDELDTIGNKEATNITPEVEGTEWKNAGIVVSNEDGDLDMIDVDDDSDDQIGMTKWGATIEQNDEDEMDDLTITLPKDQTEEVVTISSGVVEASETEPSEGEVTTTEINPISVGAAKLDTEVDDVAAQNAIVVGGPCANSAAASLMGNPEDCTAGFEEGKAIIQMYENDDNVALLVAGMTALDTRRAARALASGEEMSGSEVEVTGTTLTDIQVSAVEETVEETVEDVADEEEEAADDEE